MLGHAPPKEVRNLQANAASLKKNQGGPRLCCAVASTSPIRLDRSQEIQAPKLIRGGPN